ncbi:MAG TPA: PAS domain-containing protein [Polyangiaceae bacterium]|nr:PAS domain-containing protein [Polyangiaceae bacterium]
MSIRTSHASGKPLSQMPPGTALTAGDKNVPQAQTDVELLRARVAELEHELERLAEAQDQVLGARAQAQALLDNIPHMAWMKNTVGVFLAVNEAFARASGRSKSEILGRTDRDIWPAELAERYMSDDLNVVESGEKFSAEEPIAEASGIKWFETFKTPIRDSRGVVVGTVGLARDVTERKQAEEQRQTLERRMQQTQKLESLGVLAGGIAHDFNNLLVGVLSNAELALGSLGEAPKLDVARQRVQAIRNAAMHASELTNQMLAYSGRGRFEVRSISLNEMVRDMSHLLGASISKKAQVHYQLLAELPAVRADVAQMHQLVMNLITNASEAFDDRAGDIWVRTGVERVEDAVPDLYGPTPLAPGQYVFFEVTDDGCGMDAETRARLFEPFFTTKFTGRGLGLSAVQGIVRGHAGGITLRSAVGAGTTIRVLLPRSEHPRSEPPRSERAPVREWPTGSLVMLVDDNPRVREVTKMLLNSIGFEVLSVASGREAIQKFEQRSAEISVVLLDATMPDLSGEQVLRELRKRRADLPVIICSGYSEQEIGCRFGSAQVASFLQKPYPLELLEERLSEALSARRAPS